MSASLNNMPSVIYLIRVFGDVTSSKRIEYPTSSPSTHPISSATRAATVVAATLLGCVIAIQAPGPVHPVSYKYCGNSIYINTESWGAYESTFHIPFVHKL